MYQDRNLTLPNSRNTPAWSVFADGLGLLLPGGTGLEAVLQPVAPNAARKAPAIVRGGTVEGEPSDPVAHRAEPADVDDNPSMSSQGLACWLPFEIPPTNLSCFEVDAEDDGGREAKVDGRPGGV